MLQIFSRTTRNARRILTIGCVTQDAEMGAQFKAFVAERDGVDLTLIHSSAVTATSPPPKVSVFVYDLDVSTESSVREFDRFMQSRPRGHSGDRAFACRQR